MHILAIWLNDFYKIFEEFLKISKKFSFSSKRAKNSRMIC